MVVEAQHDVAQGVEVLIPDPVRRCPDRGTSAPLASTSIDAPADQEVDPVRRRSRTCQRWRTQRGPIPTAGAAAPRTEGHRTSSRTALRLVGPAMATEHVKRGAGVGGAARGCVSAADLCVMIRLHRLRRPVQRTSSRAATHASHVGHSTRAELGDAVVSTRLVLPRTALGRDDVPSAARGGSDQSLRHPADAGGLPPAVPTGSSRNSAVVPSIDDVTCSRSSATRVARGAPRSASALGRLRSVFDPHRCGLATSVLLTLLRLGHASDRRYPPGAAVRLRCTPRPSSDPTCSPRDVRLVVERADVGDAVRATASTLTASGTSRARRNRAA